MNRVQRRKFATKHHFCFLAMGCFHEEVFLRAVVEGGGDFGGGVETAAAVGFDGCGVGVQGECFDDCGVEFHHFGVVVEPFVDFAVGAAHATIR